MAGDHPERPQVFSGKPYKLKGLRDAIFEALEQDREIFVIVDNDIAAAMAGAGRLVVP